MSTLNKLDSDAKLSKEMRKEILRMKPDPKWKSNSVLHFHTLQSLLRLVHRDSTLTGAKKDELFANGAREIAQFYSHSEA